MRHTDPTSFELDSKLEILELLLGECITLLPKVNSRGQTALHMACWAIRSDVVGRLLELDLLSVVLQSKKSSMSSFAARQKTARSQKEAGPSRRGCSQAESYISARAA